MGASESPFESYKSKWILFFANLICSSSGPKALKNCLCFAKFNCSEKLQNIFEIGFKKVWSDCAKDALWEKKNFERKNSQTRFCWLYVKLATVQIWRQMNKFPWSFSSLKCPLQVKKLIRENSAKNLTIIFILFQNSWYSLIASSIIISFNLM